MAARSKDQQRVEGAAALRLIEAAAATGPGASGGPSNARPLPPDATISIRV